MSSTEIIHAYRHLYRSLLYAVRFSTPARYVGRNQLRRAFREAAKDKDAAFDAAAVKRTIWFLEAAGKEAGTEHKILKNLLKVAWHREQESKKFWRGSKGGVEGGKRSSELWVFLLLFFFFTQDYETGADGVVGMV